MPEPSVETVGRLRELLRWVGYTEEGLRERLGASGPVGSAVLAATQQRRLARPDPLAVMARLFGLGQPVTVGEAAAAAAPVELSELAEAGFVELRGDEAHALVRISHHDGLLIVSDGAGDSERHVHGVSPSSVATSLLTTRRRVGAAIDLGTGSGIQALLAARHAAHVVGVDINPRALAFSAINARLNQIDNVSWLEGNWLDPVQGRQFDLIVVNPPYVISPDRDYLYRDSGLAGDELGRQLVTAIPPRLAEGGIAHVTLSWTAPDNGDWAAPVRRWVEGRGCDALLLRFSVQDADLYAADWNESLLAQDRIAFERTVDRWMERYREWEIERIAWGHVVLRRRAAGRNWFAALDVPRGCARPAGEHVLRLIDCNDYLAHVGGDKSLLDAVFGLVPGHRVQQTLSYRDGRYRSDAAVVRARSGLRLDARIDPDALEVLFRCDGERSLRALVKEVATGSPGDEGTLSGLVCAAARTLLGAGLLVPPTGLLTATSGQAYSRGKQ